MSDTYLFTSESVTEGHPDKVADQISDAVLDAVLADDRDGRVACETLVTTGLAMVAGEISTKTYVDIPQLVRKTIREIGYTSCDYGFDCETCAVLTSIDEQSQNIAKGVDVGGAGDQGLMFGYACRETAVLMPLPIILAHRLAQRLAQVRQQELLPWVRPDGKSQVTVAYRDGRPVGVKTVVVSTQHAPTVDYETIKKEVIAQVIRPILAAEDLDTGDITFLVNPTKEFEVGGPKADCGLTGRKIIVDTYGGSAPHGGGAFSGKDPTKVDRSASYAARYVAKNIVAAELAERCQVQLAYAIGVTEPVSVAVETFGTGRVPRRNLERAVRDVFDLTPRGIITMLNLARPIYRRTAAYGHFGREEDGFTWERTDRVEELQRLAE